MQKFKVSGSRLFIWTIIRRCRFIAGGLRRAGFRGGWLDRGTSLNCRRSQCLGHDSIFPSLLCMHVGVFILQPVESARHSFLTAT